MANFKTSSSVLITRPEFAAHNLAKRLQVKGYFPVILPFSKIEKCPWQWPSFAYSALLATSANAFWAIADWAQMNQSAALKKISIFCVGSKTAQAAQAQGFTNIQYIADNVDNLCQFLQNEKLKPDSADIWLYLAGKPRRPVLENFLIQQNIVYKLLEVYQSREQTPSALEIAKLPPVLDYVLIYSSRIAQKIAVLQKHITDKTKILCLSSRIAASLPARLQKQAVIAQKPNQDALLALLSACR